MSSEYLESGSVFARWEGVLEGGGSGAPSMRRLPERAQARRSSRRLPSVLSILGSRRRQTVAQCAKLHSVYPGICIWAPPAPESGPVRQSRFRKLIVLQFSIFNILDSGAAGSEDSEDPRHPATWARRCHEHYIYNTSKSLGHQERAIEDQPQPDRNSTKVYKIDVDTLGRAG